MATKDAIAHAVGAMAWCRVCDGMAPRNAGYMAKIKPKPKPKPQGGLPAE